MREPFDKDSQSSKAPYHLATLENNQGSEAFRTLQQKIKGKGGFWSKKVGGTLYKFWFNYNDEKVICYRKEG